MTDESLELGRQAARDWFESLQAQLCARLERLEHEAPGPFGEEGGPGRFERRPWSRTEPEGRDGGGGRMAVMRGRLFEKAGIHFSAVHGRFPPQFAAQIPGAEADPSFWAAGVSLIVHPWSPHVPTGHMNTRFVVTTKAWFGGGGDLTPMLDRRRSAEDADAVLFHSAFRRACERHPGSADYERYKAWCDEYFYLKHRQEPRGVGGVFFDYLDGAEGGGLGFPADFAFVKDIGETFGEVYSQIVRRNWATPWTPRDREEQMRRRGRYVEFNLLYDRGTIFGLNTGGNVEAILSSMPPIAAWP